MSILRYVLVKAGLSERRSDWRISAHGLDVSYGTGLEHKRAKVKDISATGIFIVTEDRLPPGTVVQLLLKKRGRPDADLHREVRLRARCIRQGEEGVGLTFVEDPSRAAQWSRSMALSAELFAKCHSVGLFRSTRALAFLMQIAPAAEEQVLQFLRGISREHAERVIDILINTDERLTARNLEPKTVLSPSLLLRILDYGSRAADESLLHSWVGMLASCCIDQPLDESMGRLVLLLSRLEHDYVSILTAACNGALRTGWQAGFVFPSPIYSSLDEIRTISGIRNPAAVERNLNHLHQLGLMEKTIKPLGFAQPEQVNITPTALGLNLYAACRGDFRLPEALEATASSPEMLECPPTLEMAS